MALSMFKDLWGYRVAFQKNQSKALEQEVSKTESKIEQLLDRVVDAESEGVVSAYEKRIGELQLEKQIKQEKIAKCGRPIRDFDESFRTAINFLGNPHQLWATGHMADRHAVMKLTFTDKLGYVRGEGFRTPETALPFKALRGISGGENKMVRPERFELPTNWFEASYSIQLSYGRILASC